MDLLQTVRKEGSRGGRGDFTWDNVKSDQHRENYLGHSLMAPVGRWQNGRDLNWYSKAEETGSQSAVDARNEELKRIKKAEADAMAVALGLPVAHQDAEDVNSIPLGDRHERSGEIKPVASGRESNDPYNTRKSRRRRSRSRSIGRDRHRRSRQENDDTFRRRRSRSRSRDRYHRHTTRSYSRDRLKEISKHKSRRRSRGRGDANIDDRYRTQERHDRSRSPHRRHTQEY